MPTIIFFFFFLDRGDLEEIESELRGKARLEEITQDLINQL